MKTTNAFLALLIVAGIVQSIKPSELELFPDPRSHKEINTAEFGDWENPEEEMETLGLITAAQCKLTGRAEQHSKQMIAYQLGEYNKLVFYEDGVDTITQSTLRTFEGDLETAHITAENKHLFGAVFGVDLEDLDQETIREKTEQCAYEETRNPAIITRITKHLNTQRKNLPKISEEKMLFILRQATIQASDLATFKILVGQENPEPALKELFQRRKELFASCGYCQEELQTLIDALPFVGMEECDLEGKLTQARELLERKSQAAAPSYFKTFFDFLASSYNFTLETAQSGLEYTQDTLTIFPYLFTGALRPLGTLGMQLNPDYRGQVSPFVGYIRTLHQSIEQMPDDKSSFDEVD